MRLFATDVARSVVCVLGTPVTSQVATPGAESAVYGCPVVLDKLPRQTAQPIEMPFVNGKLA